MVKILLIDVSNLTIFHRYKIVLDSDAAEFVGHSRLDPNCEYLVDSQPWHDRPFSLLVSPITKQLLP